MDAFQFARVVPERYLRMRPELQVDVERLQLFKERERKAKAVLESDKPAAEKLESLNGLFQEAPTATETPVEPPLEAPVEPSVEEEVIVNDGDSIKTDERKWMHLDRCRVLRDH